MDDHKEKAISSWTQGENEGAPVCDYQNSQLEFKFQKETFRQRRFQSIYDYGSF